jgi:hypothetical protein
LLNTALVQQRETMQRADITRTGSTVELTNPVVQAIPDGSVRVTAEVKRTWTDSVGTTTGMAQARTTASTAGQVEGIESTLSIFVFNRCGNITIIDVPLPNYEDTSDGHDPCSGFVNPDGTVEEVCGVSEGGGSCSADAQTRNLAAQAATSCGPPSAGAPRRCVAKTSYMFCEVIDNLGAKGWFFKTTMQSYWGDPVPDGSIPARAVWKLKQRDGKNAFMQKAAVYPSSGSSYGWGSAFAKTLAKDKSTKIGISGAACFIAKKIDVLAIGNISASISPFKWGEVGAGVEIGADAGEKCSDYKAAKDGDSHILTVSDERNLVSSVCVFNNATGDSCDIARYRQAMVADLDFDFWYKGTNPTTGKAEGKHYTPGPQGMVRHEFECKVERVFDSFLFFKFIEPIPIDCAGFSNLRGKPLS